MCEKKSFGIGKSFVLGLLLGVALVASAYILAGGFGKIANNFGAIAKPDRVVSVRGLAEREVDANLAVWPMTFSIGGNNLQDLQKDIVDKIAISKAYLVKHGLNEADYTVQAPSINDTALNYYGGEKPKFAYIARQTILVRSSNVAAVMAAQSNVLDLMGQDIAVLQDYDSQIRYEYTSLNSIKPEMIGETTKNARAAAEQFANDSGSKVGKIRTATQGWFSINDATVGLEQKKNVRVVTTVEFILTD